MIGLVVLCHCEVVRQVGVYRVRHVSAAVGEGYSSDSLHIGRSAIAGEHEETLLVCGRALSADCLDELGIELVDIVPCVAVIALAVAPFAHGGVACLTGLVHALEYEVLVVVLECCGYLLPDSGELGFCVAVGVVVELSDVDPILVVDVEDNVHIVLDAVVNDFLDARHPSAVDVVAAVEVRVPCGGDSYRIEALFLDRVYHRLSGLGLSPAHLRVDARVAVAACSVEGIAEIPAYFHLARDIERTHSARCVGFCHFKYEGKAEAGHKTGCRRGSTYCPFDE